MSKCKYDSLYIDICKKYATMSSAKKKKVGAVIVKENNIIADGYNGTPSGFDNECEHFVSGTLKTKREVLHAESNALMKLAKGTNSSKGSTIYLTLSPCFDCAKLIVQAEIERVVCAEAYRITDGIDFLRKNNIQVDII